MIPRSHREINESTKVREKQGCNESEWVEWQRPSPRLLR